MKQSGCDVPEWLAQLKKPTKQEKKKFEKTAIKRRRIDTCLRTKGKTAKPPRNQLPPTTQEESTEAAPSVDAGEA